VDDAAVQTALSSAPNRIQGSWVTGTITIDGTAYTVATVIDADHMTVT
jgi:hypothetical protein